MKTKLGLVLVLLILAFPMVFAVDTQIDVKTMSDHKVSIFVYPAGKLASVNSYHGMADGVGKYSVIHSSSHEDIDVLVKITKDGEKIFLEKFKDYKSGTMISIRIDYDEINGEYDPAVEKIEEETETNEEVIDEGIVEGTNDEIVEESVIEEESETGESGTTGEVVKESSIGLSNGVKMLIYYILGGMFVFLIVFFVVRQFLVPRNNALKDTKKTSKINLDKKVVGGDEVDAKVLTKLEEQIKSAQSQLELLKNKEKIKEAERKLEDDKLELERLRKGM